METTESDTTTGSSYSSGEEFLSPRSRERRNTFHSLNTPPEVRIEEEFENELGIREKKKPKKDKEKRSSKKSKRIESEEKPKSQLRKTEDLKKFNFLAPGASRAFRLQNQKIESAPNTENPPESSYKRHKRRASSHDANFEEEEGAATLKNDRRSSKIEEISKFKLSSLDITKAKEFQNEANNTENNDSNNNNNSNSSLHVNSIANRKGSKSARLAKSEKLMDLQSIIATLNEKEKQKAAEESDNNNNNNNNNNDKNNNNRTNNNSNSNNNVDDIFAKQRRTTITNSEYFKFQERKKNLVKEFDLQVPIAKKKAHQPELDEVAKVKPGSDYFLTDTDKELIKKLEFQETLKNFQSYRANPSSTKMGYLNCKDNSTPNVSTSSSNNNSVTMLNLKDLKDDAKESSVGATGSLRVTNPSSLQSLISPRFSLPTQSSTLSLTENVEGRGLTKKILNYLKYDDTKEEREKEDKEKEIVEYKFIQYLKEKTRKSKLLNENEENLGIRMRNRIINEIVITERDYIDDLDVLIHHFQEPIAEKHLISDSMQSAIFSNLSTLREINYSLLQRLEVDIHREEGPYLIDFFSLIISKNKIYYDYCNNHHTANKHANSLLKKSVNFRQFIEEQQAHPKCNGMPFVSFLIKPVQRICKYPLLLNELMKQINKESEDYESLNNVYQRLSLMVNSINETMRVTNNMTKISKIQSFLGLKDMELLQPGREFVKEGFVDEITKGTETNTMFYYLFNDILLRAEKKKSKFGTTSREKFILIEQVPLYNIKIGEETADSFEMLYNKKSIKAIINNQQEKDDWVNTLKSLTSQIYNNQGTNTNLNQVLQASNKLKCYLNRGTPQQRIRKIGLENIKSFQDLQSTIRKEFEWDDSVNFTYVYIDRDDEEIEISSSLSIEDITSDATGFIITSYSN